MSDYRPAGYNFENEIAAANAAGVASGTASGEISGYANAAVDHRNPALINGNDDQGNPTGYNEGYNAASIDHTNPTAIGSDPKGRTYGYKAGYDVGYPDGIIQGTNQAAHGLITQTGDMNLTLGVYQKVNFGSMQHAKTMNISSNGLRVLEAGYYDVGAGLSITVLDSGSGNTFGYLYMGIVKNGTYLGYSRSDVVAYSDDNTGMNCHFKNIYMAVNDVFYVYVKPVFSASNVNNVYARAWASGSNRQGSFLMAAKRT